MIKRKHLRDVGVAPGTHKARPARNGAGRPGFAAVDVFEDEPVLGGNHPLLKMKNALCTPHLGYNEKTSYEAVYAGGVEQILAYAAGNPVNVLNPEVLAKK